MTSHSRPGKLKCDQIAVKILHERIRSLDEHGGVMDMKTLWLGAKGASQTLDGLKALKQTLDAISSSLADAITLVKDSPLRGGVQDAHGILHLPAELLANIFEQAVADGPLKVIKAIRISNVCKSFRSIALNIPSLWDDVSDDWRRELVELLLARCNKPMIQARFNSDLKETRKTYGYKSESSFSDSSFMGIVESLPINSVLQGFSVVYNDLDDGRQAVAALADFYKSGRFAHLQHLGMSCRVIKYIQRSSKASFLFDPDAETLSSLELPKLKSLRCDSIYPRSINAPQLVECFVSLYSFCRVKWDTQELLHFLGSIPSIQFLTLEFRNAELWSPDIFMSTHSKAIELSNVRHISVVIREHTSPELLEDLMTKLKLPNVKRMSIEAHFSNRDVLLEWFTALFAQSSESEEDGPRIFRDLEKLDIQIFHENFNEDDIFPCDLVFSTMPSLRYLSVEAPGLRCPTNWDWDPSDLEELRVLRLKNCHYIAHKHEGEPIECGMEVLGSFKRLERVEFDDCSDMMKWKKDIEEVFPKEKLHWSTSTDQH